LIEYYFPDFSIDSIKTCLNLLFADFVAIIQTNISSIYFIY